MPVGLFRARGRASARRSPRWRWAPRWSSATSRSTARCGAATRPRRSSRGVPRLVRDIQAVRAGARRRRQARLRQRGARPCGSCGGSGDRSEPGGHHAGPAVAAALPGRLQAFPWATWQEEFARRGGSRLRRASSGSSPRIAWQDNPIWTDAGIALIRARGARDRHRCHLALRGLLHRPAVRPRVTRPRGGRAPACSSASFTKARARRHRRDRDSRPRGRGDPQSRGRVACCSTRLRGPLALARSRRHPTGARVRPAGARLLRAARRRLIRRSAPPTTSANATANGYDVRADLRALGPRLRAVHIKDRRAFGTARAAGRRRHRLRRGLRRPGRGRLLRSADPGDAGGDDSGR